MYMEFTTKNLREYNKIINVLVSCSKPEQFNITKNMVDNFARNCDFRLYKLKRRALFHFYSLNIWKEYKSYRTTTNIQIESIVNHCNEWLKNYDEFLVEQKLQTEKEEQKKKSKKDIKGLASLFKKKPKKKGTN